MPPLRTRSIALRRFLGVNKPPQKNDGSIKLDGSTNHPPKIDGSIKLGGSTRSHRQHHMIPLSSAHSGRMRSEIQSRTLGHAPECTDYLPECTRIRPMRPGMPGTRVLQNSRNTLKKARIMLQKARNVSQNAGNVPQNVWDALWTHSRMRRMCGIRSRMHKNASNTLRTMVKHAGHLPLGRLLSYTLCRWEPTSTYCNLSHAFQVALACAVPMFSQVFRRFSQALRRFPQAFRRFPQAFRSFP